MQRCTPVNPHGSKVNYKMYKDPFFPSGIIKCNFNFLKLV